MTPTEAKNEAKKDLYLLRDRPWREIDKETYEWLEQCVLNFSRVDNAFYNGEPQVDDLEGNTYYMTCRNTFSGQAKQYWFRYSTIKEFNSNWGLAAPLPPAPAQMVGVLLAG